MYVVDTNVLSDLRRPERAEPALVAWSKQTQADSLFVSVVSIWEIEQGILAVQKRDPAAAKILRSWLEDKLIPQYKDRFLSVDMATARACAALHVPKTQSYRDSLIAATALALGYTVVTRNVSDFAPMGVPYINPWVPRGSNIEDRP